MKINILTLSLLLVSAVGTRTLEAQNAANSSFWEKVDSRNINPPKGTPVTLGEIRSEGTLLINTTGTMLLLFGNSGLPATPVPQYAYVSIDGGVTWEYQLPFTKYNGYQIYTYDLSASGKYFITGSFNIGGTDKKPVYFFSTDGKNWSAINKSDLLDKGYFGTGNHKIIESKNGKLSDYLNLYPGDIGDYGATYELHKIYYPDGSVKTVKDEKFDGSKRGRNMANFYSYQPATDTYVRGTPVGDYKVIREAYYTCEGKYFANIGGGFSLTSDDDISYKLFSSGLFVSEPSMREQYFPICNALFGLGRTPSGEIKLFFRDKNGAWEDTGYFSGDSKPPAIPRIMYNPKTKRFYIFKNFKFGYTGDSEKAVLLRSRKPYECDCISNNTSATPVAVTPADNHCVYPVFDKESKVITLTYDGIKIIGTEKFISMVKQGMDVLKKASPDLYNAYIKDGGAPYFSLKGIKMDCDFGYNHPDEDMYIELSIPSDQYYDTYIKYPEIVGGSVLHEATHVRQADVFIKTIGHNYHDYLVYYGQSLLKAQEFERAALENQINFLKVALPKYDLKSAGYKYLYDSVYIVRKNWLEGNYPDMNNDGHFDEKDQGKINNDILSRLSTDKPTTTVVVKVEQQVDGESYGLVKTQQGSNLRLRSGPSEKANILNQIPNGTKIKILGEDNKIVTVNGETGKWLRIEYEGTVGWAWGKFILKD